MYRIRKELEPEKGSERRFKAFLLDDGIRVAYSPVKGLWEANNGTICKPVHISGKLSGFSIQESYSREAQEIFSLSEDGIAYLEYNQKVGGSPFGCTVGMPVVNLEQYGGLSGMYRECIKRGISWEELLQWDGHSDELGEWTDT